MADLFRLVCVVGKVDQPPEEFNDMDSAASNGSVRIAKPVTGLVMLSLMQDKLRRHPVLTLCYRDEALSLDAQNQRSLIDTASDFGFALIFASPAPLTTVRYCVPILHRDGKNHVQTLSGFRRFDIKQRVRRQIAMKAFLTHAVVTTESASDSPVVQS